MKLATTLLSLTLTGALLAGCGTTPDTAIQPSGGPATGLSGRILGETGGAEAGVRLVVHERTTNYKGVATSNSDGSFQLTLPPGVYDLGLDREGDISTATNFYGPITVSTQETRDFVLHASNGRPAGQVFGQLLLQPGVPASNRKVNLRSGHLPKNADGTFPPQSVSGTTGADGSFQLLLSSERELGVDVETFDAAGNFDEFIDIGKLSKPAYVEFATELPVATNLLRSDQSEKTLTANQAVTPPPGFSPYSLWLSYTWEQGLIPVSSYTYKFFDEIETPEVGDRAYNFITQIDGNGVPEGLLRVDQNGFWWWKYAVNLHTDFTGYYEFQDQTGDNYSLYVIENLVTYTHKVNYNSKQPAIQAIVWNHF